VVRAGALGLPMALALIGGEPDRFAPLTDLHRRALREYGHDPAAAPTAVHAHGFVADDAATASEQFFPSYQVAMTQLGRERGWPPLTRQGFEGAVSPRGSLVLGSPDQVAAKIVRMQRTLGIDRFMLHVSVGTMPHEQVLHASSCSARRSPHWSRRSSPDPSSPWRPHRGERRHAVSAATG